MQNEVFDFQGQKWVARRGCGELMLSLGHSKDPNTALHVHIDVDLVPSWVRDQEGEDGMGTVDEHRHMHLAVSGNMPAIGRWQDLAGPSFAAAGAGAWFLLGRRFAGASRSATQS